MQVQFVNSIPKSLHQVKIIQIRRQFLVAANVNNYVQGSNLGVLESIAKKDAEEFKFEASLTAKDQTSFGELYLDGSAIFGSSLLLIILLALSFERILGLDRIIANWLREWKKSREYERRNTSIQARERLEQLYQEGEEQ